jgi:hypothetical protein
MRPVFLSTSAMIAIAFTGTAQAASLSRTLDGNRLELHTNCVASVDIQPQADLQGKIQIEATADTQEELNHLSFTSGDAARVERAEQCHNVAILGISFGTKDISLRLSIHVPQAMPLDVQNDGSGKYVIGPVGGPLKAAFHGSGDLKGAKFSRLDLETYGSSDAQFDQVDGAGTIEIHASGDVKIGTATMPSLKINLRGSGGVHIGAGEIGTLAVSTIGSGDVMIGARVVNGAGTIEIDGSGDVKIGTATMPSLKIGLRGSGGVHIGAGEIGTLAVSTIGSGDVMIGARVKDLALTASGSGDVEVPEVTGTVSQSVTGSSKIHIGR